MPVRISRRKLSEQYVSRLLLGVSKAQLDNELAGYLLEMRRTHELRLIVRDIEQQFADSGIVIARVQTAHELSDASRQDIERFVKDHVEAKTVQLETSIEPNLLGGVKVSVPGREYDASLRRKLHSLTTLKV